MTKDSTLMAPNFSVSDHYDPHALLGLHADSQGQKVIRVWRPGAEKIQIEVFGKLVDADLVNETGLFEYRVPANTTPLDYRIYHQNGLLAYDPYAFWPTLGDIDRYLFTKGVHYQIYEVMGARLTWHQGCQGVKFAVWAPSARSVALVGDFNFWDGRRKTAVASVRLRSGGSGKVDVNGRLFEEYFPLELQRRAILAPLDKINAQGRYDMVIRVKGGGVEAQAIAIRHGLSRALVANDEALRHDLKSEGFLTRDSRKKERKKYGRAGARKRFQFSKR